jgi:hypothetical protein
VNAFEEALACRKNPASKAPPDSKVLGLKVHSDPDDRHFRRRLSKGRRFRKLLWAEEWLPRRSRPDKTSS